MLETLTSAGRFVLLLILLSLLSEGHVDACQLIEAVACLHVKGTNDLCERMCRPMFYDFVLLYIVPMPYGLIDIIEAARFTVSFRSV